MVRAARVARVAGTTEDSAGVAVEMAGMAVDVAVARVARAAVEVEVLATLMAAAGGTVG